MPRNHTNFPELDLNSSLTPEERDIIEKAEELIHDLTFLNTSKPENILDWLYEFSYTTKSYKTRRGYNYILQVFQAKGIPYHPQITEADIHNKDQFAIYLVSIAITAMRQYNAIPNRLEPLIVYWKKLHTKAKTFEIMNYQDGENIEAFLRNAVKLSEEKKIDVYIKFDHAVYFRDHRGGSYHSEDEEILYIVGALKSRLDSVATDFIPLSHIKSLNFQNQEDVLDYLFRAVWASVQQFPLSQEWIHAILDIFYKNGYTIQTVPPIPPQEHNKQLGAKYIIESVLYELYHFKTITNQNNWFLANIFGWKNQYGTREIWSAQKVFENGQKRIPKVLRQTSDTVQEVMDDGEKGRLSRLIGYIRRK